MPLIEIKEFPSAIHYLERLLQISTPDLIDTWEGSTPYQIYINRYKLALIECEREQIFKSNTGIAVEGMLVKYIFGLREENNSIFKNFDFEKFFSSEVLFFSQNREAIYSDVQIIKLETYFEFLYQNESKIVRIIKIPEIINLDIQNLSERLHSFYKSNDLNLYQLDEQLFILFDKLDNYYKLFQRLFKDESEGKVWQREEFLFMDWDYLKEPFQLEDNREDVIKFVRALMGYLKEALYQRKVFLQWHKTPNTYLIIEEFIEELKQEIAEVKSVQSRTTKPDKQIEKVEEYPRFIFASQEAYDFFCALVNQATTNKQLSFIFRQLSEIENPVLIVVKDKPFREWFNSQPFQIKAEEFTSTYTNSKNEDRIWVFNTVKALFYNKS